MPDTTEVFNQSLDRCVIQPSFLHRFYEVLVESSPEIAEKFEQTDLTRQTAALKAALYVLLFAWDWNLKGDSYLVGLARRHSRTELDVEPHLYDVWLDCLIQTVKEFDNQFNPEIEDAWRTVLAPGIEFMKSYY